MRAGHRSGLYSAFASDGSFSKLRGVRTAVAPVLGEGLGRGLPILLVVPALERLRERVSHHGH